jgi:hypothetical protein
MRFYADFTGADPRGREPAWEQPPFEDTVEIGRYDALAPDAGGYPDGNPKTLMGAQKPDLSVIPPIALLHLATAMMNGAKKYGPFNWREKSISARPYLAALLRHAASCLDGEDYSADTVEAELPVHHLGHVMACCAIYLDAESIGMLNDDRPKVKGKTGSAIEKYVKEKRL